MLRLLSSSTMPHHSLSETRNPGLVSRTSSRGLHDRLAESKNTALPVPQPRTDPSPKREIWWSNAVFFVLIHILSLYCALWISPWSQVPWDTKMLFFAISQCAMFGITMGYHRLWSHNAFAARLPLRIVLAAFGTLGVQGSIKWWVLRHRLHHRFTDDVDYDPYAATRGLFYSHVGWIFIKSEYPRMKLLDKRDLERDAVVRFQHRFYAPLVLFLAFILPAIIGMLWGDTLGAFVWGGLVARVLIWHCVFCINSLAHWVGDQPYSEDVTARGNLLLALLTAGEGNHNFHHAFPSDYRNGPCAFDWDPTKWLVFLLHRFTSLIPSVRKTHPCDVLHAQRHMLEVRAAEFPVGSKDRVVLEERADALRLTLGKNGSSSAPFTANPPGRGEVDAVWDSSQLRAYVASGKRVILIDGCVVDVTKYIASHPGGASLLMQHLALPASPSGGEGSNNRLQDATLAFLGQYTNHSWSARETMKKMVVARLASDEARVQQ